MSAAPHAPASVARRGRALRDDAVRKTLQIALPPSRAEGLRARFERERPRIQDFFGTALRGVETPRLLTYRRGDYFRLHRDGAKEGGRLAYLGKRKISAVAFLSGGRTLGAHRGGELILYGMLSGPAALRRVGIEIRARPGWLVAFPSDVAHEVREVTRGLRRTAVTWYY